MYYSPTICSLLLSDETVNVDNGNVNRPNFLNNYQIKVIFEHIYENRNGTDRNSTVLSKIYVQSTPLFTNSHIRVLTIKLSKFDGGYKKFVTFNSQVNPIVHNGFFKFS